jgi:hypothetical protein
MPDAPVRASSRNRLSSWWRRPLLPALSSCIYAAVGIGVCAFAVTASRPSLTPLESNFVGNWHTAHGNVDTRLELHGDHAVTVSQTIRVALAPGITRVFGPTVTTGRWHVDGGHLQLETTSAELRDPPWKKLAMFARSQRWPERGELHRNWRIESLDGDRFGFTDTGTGQSGRAIKAGVE